MDGQRNVPQPGTGPRGGLCTHLPALRVCAPVLFLDSPLLAI